MLSVQPSTHRSLSPMNPISAKSVSGGSYAVLNDTEEPTRDQNSGGYRQRPCPVSTIPFAAVLIVKNTHRHLSPQIVDCIPHRSRYEVRPRCSANPHLGPLDSALPHTQTRPVGLIRH